MWAFVFITAPDGLAHFVKSQSIQQKNTCIGT